MATPPDLGTVAPGEGPLDELLATLQQAGEVDSQGAFTLDRQKARQKMQRFQLAQPARYVLELVQAAVLRGAQYITIEIEHNDIHLRCNATPFTLHDFEQIYDALFIRSRADKRQALRHLALGASTALSLNPAWVRIEGGGTAGAYLQLYPGDKEHMGQVAQSDLGLHVHVRQRGRLGMWSRILGYYENPKPHEFEILREHCGLSMVPIEINGMPIAVGYQLPNTMNWMNYQYGNTRGVIGVLTNFGAALPPGYPFALPSTMHLMRNCVSFEIDRPPLLLPGLATLVESPSFHLDISHQKVVRNESYEEAVRLVLAQQIQLLVRECKRLHSKERALYPEMLEGLVLALLSRLGSVDPIMRWAGRSDAGPVLSPRGFPETVKDAEAILNARLWPTPSGERVSLSAIIQDLRTYGTLAVTTTAERARGLNRPLVILLRDAVTQEVFANVFRGRLENRQSASPAEYERLANLERWRQRKHAPKLPEAPYLAALRIDGVIVQGELGVELKDDGAGDDLYSRLRTPGGLRLTLLYKGGVVVVKELAVAVPGLRAVLSGEFSPTSAWNDVEPDAQLETALRVLLAALPMLAEQVAAAPSYVPAKKLQRVLRELVILSRSASAQAALLNQLGLVARAPLPEAVPLGRISSQPLFETVTGSSLSIDALREHFKEQGYLAVISTDASGVGPAQQEDLAFLFLNEDRRARAWQAAQDLPGLHFPTVADGKAAPPRYVIWQTGSLDLLREALSEVVPPAQLWDAVGWLAATLRRMQQQLSELEIAAPAHELITPASSASADQESTGNSTATDSAVAPSAPTGTALAPEDGVALTLPPPVALNEPAPYFEDDRFIRALNVELLAVAGSVPKLCRRIDPRSIGIVDDSDKLVVHCTEHEILLNRGSAIMWRALREADRDPAVMWFILSAVITALRLFERVTEAEEAQFHSLLLRRAMPGPHPGD